MRKIGRAGKIRARWKKLSVKKKVLATMATVILLAAAVWGIFRNQSAETGGQNERIVQEATAKTGTVSNTIVGTGNLESDDSISIKIPSGIIIDQVNVESGDQVEKGDVLAVADEASVTGAIESVQEEIEELDEKISKTQSESQTQEVTAKVAGRVKKIYGAVGEDVTDCMVSEGALMLLSIDGKMAVDLRNLSGVAVGDSVTVTLSDGTARTGTVETLESGVGTVLFSDGGVGLNATVAVTAADGTDLGSSVAYIHQQLEVTATGGTIQGISVSEDQEVSSGTTLLTLEVNGQSAQYKEEIAQREALTESLQKLIAIAKSGTITATESGTVSQVNISAEESDTSSAGSSAQDDTGTAAASKMSYTQTSSAASNGGDGWLLLSSAQQESADAQGDESLVTEDSSQEDGEETVPEESLIVLQIIDSGISTQSVLAVERPQKGGVPQTSADAADGSYSASIAWSPDTESFEPGTSYRATVTLQAAEGYCLSADSVVQVQTGLLSGLWVSEDGKTLRFQITYPETASEEGEEQDAQTEQRESQLSQEEQVTQTDESRDSTQGSAQQENAADSAATDAAKTAATQAETGSAQQTNVSDTEESTYSSQVTAFTLASDESMVISVSVDELDINAVSSDQTAEVTLDAIEDQTFTGTVTKVGNSTSGNTGGVAKYTVEITIPKEEEMKVGMNASATIVVEEKKDVVTIPVSALQERGDKTFVYTQKDSEGNLSGEQEVTTGLSDGDQVEITEGLSDGDTVYYQKVGGSGQQGGETDQNMPGNMDEFGGGKGGQMEAPSGGDFGGGGMPPGGAQ